MRDDRATIYPTLWKKMKVFGCPRDFAFALIGMCAPIPLIARLIVAPPWNLAIAGFVAFVGWSFGAIMARIDPEFFSVWLVKKRRIMHTKGSVRGNEYLP